MMSQQSPQSPAVGHPSNNNSPNTANAGVPSQHTVAPTAVPASTAPAPAAQQQSQRSNAGKLFVGQVPYIATEELLQPLFAPYGSLQEIKIMRDPEGRSRGCAWVRYETQEQAQQAIEALHDKHTIPPQTNMLQVRFAQASMRGAPSNNNSANNGHVTVTSGPFPTGGNNNNTNMMMMGMMGYGDDYNKQQANNNNNSGFVMYNNGQQAGRGLPFGQHQNGGGYAPMYPQQRGAFPNQRFNNNNNNSERYTNNNNNTHNNNSSGYPMQQQQYYYQQQAAAGNNYMQAPPPANNNNSNTNNTHNNNNNNNNANNNISGWQQPPRGGFHSNNAGAAPTLPANYNGYAPPAQQQQRGADNIPQYSATAFGGGGAAPHQAMWPTSVGNHQW